MKLIRTEDAVGAVLCHDITQIIKGVTKDAVFRKGHIVTEEDIPVLPGAMFLLSYLGEVPIMGLPGCVMYAKRTIFDLVLPRIAAKDIITKEDLDSLGEGGLCLGCQVCTFPNCGFGK